MNGLHAGACRCGAVRFSASAPPQFTGYCHCSDCRKATGAPVAAFVGFGSGQIDWQGEPCAVFRNGPAERLYCRDCGSPVGYRDARLDNRVYFYVGVMAEPEDYPPAHHGYAGEQLPWLMLDDDLQRFEGSAVPRPAPADSVSGPGGGE